MKQSAGLWDGRIHYAVLFVFCALPLLVLCWTATHVYELGRPTAGFSVANVRAVVRDPTFRAAVTRSLVIGLVVSSVLVTVTLTATIVIAVAVRSKGLKALIVALLVAVSGGMIPRTNALTFLLADNGPIVAHFAPSGATSNGAVILYSGVGLLLAYLVLLSPLVGLVMIASRVAVPQDLLLAARDLGASEFNVQRRLVLPLMFPGIVTAFVLSFVLSVGDLVVARMVGGSRFLTVPMLMRDYTSVDDWGRASVAALFLMIAAAVVVFCGVELLHRQAR